MAGTSPAIHVFAREIPKSGMAGPRPAMTGRGESAEMAPMQKRRASL
jgi:hypothetical protein